MDWFWTYLWFCITVMSYFKAERNVIAKLMLKPQHCFWVCLVFGEKQNFIFKWEFWRVKINIKSCGWGINLLLRTAFMQTWPSRALMCQRLLRLALPVLAVYLSVCLSISTWITSLTWLRVRQVLWQTNKVRSHPKNGSWECLFLNKSANSHLGFSIWSNCFVLVLTFG